MACQSGLKPPTPRGLTKSGHGGMRTHTEPARVTSPAWKARNLNIVLTPVSDESSFSSASTQPPIRVLYTPTAAHHTHSVPSTLVVDSSFGNFSSNIVDSTSKIPKP